MSPLVEDFRVQMIEVQLISLKARKDKAEQYIQKNNFHMEWILLASQIEALENELEKVKK